MNRPGSTAFIVFTIVAGAAGQTASMTEAQKAAALDTVRAYALRYTASLPNYTCIQSTRQVITRPATLAGGPPGSALGVDLIEEQLSFVNGREVRTLTKINDVRPSAKQRAQIGTMSRGEFGNLLDTIFEPKTAAEIRWDRAATLEGRRINVFTYRVPQPHGYGLLDSKGLTKAAFEGFVYADYRTGSVVRIEMKCVGLPGRSEYRSLNLTLDYKTAKIAGKEYLLPSRYNLRYEMARNGAIIGAEYKSYRRFSADSSVKFDTDSVETPVTSAEPQPEAAVPDPEPVPAVAIAPNPVVPVAAAPREVPEPVIEPAPAVVAPPEADAPEPVFRAATQLVQVSVIAQDKDGKPVTDLRREEFQVLDNGAPQEIRLFLSDRSSPEAPAPQVPGTFTNRIASGGSSVLLFDRLFIDAGNSVFKHNARARQKALQALKAIPPGDRIAIYALGCRFQVVRELTADRDSLLDKLKTYAPAAAPCADPTVPASERGIGDPQEAAAAAMAKSHEVEGFNEIAARRQNDLGEDEFKVMADHLAGIPGRKNLIWVTSEFRISPANMKRLVDANVAIYPVDAIGSMIGTPSAKRERYEPLLALAANTGGVAFFDRDDFDAGIRQALSDGRVSYTLGFYPVSEDVPLHRLNVRVSRPGVILRYRTSYELKPPPTVSANPVEDLVQALNRPVDATVIPVTARATRNADRVELTVALDVSSLDLALSEGLWKGKVEVVARFLTAEGLPAGIPSAQTVTFNLRPATYEAMLREGEPYRSELAIPAKAAELKVLVGNVASGKIGTLTIPLSEVGPAASTGK